MKKILFQIFVFFLLGFIVFLSFSTLMPLVNLDKKVSENRFSTARALEHVKQIAQKPHPTGSDEHIKVRNYIVDRFQKLGLEVHTQNGYVIASNGVLTNPVNIVTKIEGSDPSPGNDLLLLSHYDSAPHSAIGAADDAVGVAAILESVRAFLENKTLHKNNIIICITDSEEIGLIGAELFVDQHPWMEDIGLVLNFEARGTMGPSNTILETNHGNTALVNAFSKAKPEFPMATSLMYEIYKVLPNDTDATVFRVKKDIPSFFFAFIDGHYNYHTAHDNVENLDVNSLAHQGSYLSALMPYFANADLAGLQVDKDSIYFNFPFFKLITYSNAWIFPLLIISWLIFVFILIAGFRRNYWSKNNIGRGFLALLLSLTGVGLLGFYGWRLIMNIYPHYHEIQHGFTYNGHAYLAAFVFLSLALLFGIYHWFSKKSADAGMKIAPLFIWLVINTLIAFTFKGASYFIVPVIFLEIALLYKIFTQRSDFMAMLICSIPAIFVFIPLIVLIPIALGLKSLFAGLLILALVFGLELPVLEAFTRKDLVAWVFLIAGVFFMVKAHSNSDFTPKNPKPNSLVYIADEESKIATWETYDKILDEWTQPFITEKNASPWQQVAASKYGEGYSYSSPAEYKEIPAADIGIQRDTLSADKIRYDVKIYAERRMDRMILFSGQINEFENFKTQDVAVPNLTKRFSKIQQDSKGINQRLLTYYPVNRDTLHLQFDLPLGLEAEIILYGASNNLTDNPWVKVPPRADYMMPRPFVLNDAIITRQVIRL